MDLLARCMFATVSASAAVACVEITSSAVKANGC